MIICRVPHSHGLCSKTLCLLHQKTIAHNAGGFFDGKFFVLGECVDISAFDHGGKVEARRGLFDDVGVSIGIGAQFVVEVRDDDALIACIPQKTHEAQAVGSAGDACDNGTVFDEPALFGKDGIDILKQGAYYNTEIRERSLKFRIERLQNMDALHTGMITFSRFA